MVIEKRKLMILNDLIGLKVFLIVKTAPTSSICKDNYYKSKLTL